MKTSVSILKILRDCAPRQVPEATLLDEVRLGGDPVSTMEFIEALRVLEAKRWALSMVDTLTETRKWNITDAGKAILAERGL